ncbi:MAG: hypothetical protein U9P82_09080 [Bacteroidota bacterium]|nr:hypothetical protein [Bacteroidota bacterium]
MRKISIIIISSILFFSFSAFGQQKNDEKITKNTEKEEIKEPYFFWGGNLLLAFGNLDLVDINVLFGNQLTERIALGISGKYQYYNDKRNFDPSISSTGNFEAHTYGGSVFLQFAVVKDFRKILPLKTQSGIIIHAEYELLNTKFNYIHFDAPDSNKDRYWLHNYLLGGGYVQHIGKKAKSWIILLWNLQKTEDNPYEYPQFKIGFSVAF